MMSDDFEVHGADQFLRLSKALKEAGRVELRKELHAGLKVAAKPIAKAMQDELAATVPAALRPRAARTKVAVVVATGRDPGVRLVVRYGKRGGGIGASNARLLNRGVGVRHPLFGDRDLWYTTPAPSAEGWFDRPAETAAPGVRIVLERAIDGVLDEIVREAGHG